MPVSGFRTNDTRLSLLTAPLLCWGYYLFWVHLLLSSACRISVFRMYVFAGAIPYSQNCSLFFFLCKCGNKHRIFLYSQIPGLEESSRLIPAPDSDLKNSVFLPFSSAGLLVYNLSLQLCLSIPLAYHDHSPVTTLCPYSINCTIPLQLFCKLEMSISNCLIGTCKIGCKQRIPACPCERAGSQTSGSAIILTKQVTQSELKPPLQLQFMLHFLFKG